MAQKNMTRKNSPNTCPTTFHLAADSAGEEGVRSIFSTA